MKEISDAELMRRAAAGGLGASNEIVLRHQSFVWAIACRFSGDPAEAEDITQETFCRLLKAAPRYRPTANLRTYLYRIISRICIDHARKKRPLPVNELPESADSSPGPAALMLAREQQAEIRRVINKLPPRQRLAVILKYYEDAPYADIAQALGVTVKAVEHLLSRARTTMNAELSHLREK